MGNYVKTVLLLGILSVILITLGGLFGGQTGIYIALVLSLLMNGIAYFYSDKLALAASGAKPLSKKEAPEIYQMVESLAQQMNMPMPKLYSTPAQQANAFATGRNPNHASVAVTQGILDLLTKEELKGVLAHELGHVKNRDILVATIAATLASAISFVANMTLWSGITGGGDDEDNAASGILGIIIALLVPIGASIVQMAISRQREFGADATGAKIIGDGDPLARALIKIHESARRAPMHVNPAYSSLYIDNPLGGVGSKLMHLFSTHPPVEERVKKLQKM